MMLIAFTSSHAVAGVTAERTRVIFKGDQREASLALVNRNNYPVILQAWVDDGALVTTPEDASAPIMPLPPIFRLEPGQQRSLRLLYTGGILPSEQESLYWLNLYEIPPKPIEPVPVDQTRLTITIRTQMKVIYRPKALFKGAEDAPLRLKFHSDGTAVEIENPTPYFITLAEAEVHHGSTTMPLKVDLLAPFSKQVVQAGRAVGTGDKVQFIWVDDDGNFQNGVGLLR